MNNRSEWKMPVQSYEEYALAAWVGWDAPTYDSSTCCSGVSGSSPLANA